jgi:hypothetical protein
MMSTSPVYVEKPSLLSFDKSTAIVLVAISLMIAESFNGALRFYLDQAGISVLLYGPKVACLLFFALELRTFKAGPGVWLSLLVLLLSAARRQEISHSRCMASARCCSGSPAATRSFAISACSCGPSPFAWLPR